MFSTSFWNLQQLLLFHFCYNTDFLKLELIYTLFQFDGKVEKLFAGTTTSLYCGKVIFLMSNAEKIQRGQNIDREGYGNETVDLPRYKV